MTPTSTSRDPKRQLAVFVGGGPDALAVVEPILSGRAYDLEFVDFDDEPYGTILALKPDIVVVSLDLSSEAGFRLLTMLRLDPDTVRIPVLSYLQADEIAAFRDGNVDHNPMRLPSMQAPRAQRH